MSNIDWNFPESNFSQRHGISEAGIETYRGTLFSSLAKEVCQNSLDARLDASVPVTVEFSKFQIKTKNIPGYAKLSEALNTCLHFETDQKSRIFFENACARMNDKNIDILRISDFNTTGLTGSKEPYAVNPWQSLIKSSGISDKQGAMGGSYGIGKSAPFACSDIRTVFYTSYDTEGILASQGVSRLISFPLEDDKNTQGMGYQISMSGPPKWKVGNTERFTQGIGYYGETEKNTPLFEELNLDSSFRRNGTTGTDLYIAGFLNDSKWQEELVIAILDNFLVAIYNKNLIVKIGNMTISENTLKNIIESFKISEKKKYQSIWSYYQVLTSTDNPAENPNSFFLGDTFRDLGAFELKILYDNLNRKVLISRANGMKIFDLDRLPSNVRFSAIFILSGDNLNNYFKQMEAPQHDSWEPDRHPDKNAKNVLRELKQLIINKIIELGKSNVDEYMDVEGIGKFLPDDLLLLDTSIENNKIDKISDETRKIFAEQISENPKKRNIKTTPKSSEDFNNSKINSTDDFNDEIMEVADSVFGNVSNIVEEEQYLKNEFSLLNSDSNITEIHEIKRVEDAGMRLIILNKKLKKYRLVISPQRDIEKACVRISLSGEQNNLKSRIRNAYKDDIIENSLFLNQDKIYIENLKKDEKFVMTFILNYSDECSMEVELYEYRV